MVEEKLDLGVIELPVIVMEKMKEIHSSLDEEEKKEFGEKFDYNSFFKELQDCYGWCEWINSFDGKIVDKELAEFLIQYNAIVISDNGGYPINQFFEFNSIHNVRYVICFYGWTGDCDVEPKDFSFDSIGYKESLKEVQ